MKNGIIIIDTYRSLGCVFLSIFTFLVYVFFAQSGQVRTSPTTCQTQTHESNNVEAKTRKHQLRSDNVEATTWKQQLGNDNLEATTWLGGRNENENTKLR